MPMAKRITTTMLWNFPRMNFRCAASVFVRRDGEIFHTYSTYARGLDQMMNAYNFRSDAEGAGRGELAVAHGLGAASR